MMARGPAPLLVALAAIGGLLLLALSVVLRDSPLPRPVPVQATATDGGSAAHDHASHDHSALLALPPGPDAPRLDFDLLPDGLSGWNLRLRTANFRFAPENVNRDHVPGEGHAHVYVNGEKRARLYGPWFHLGPLPKGAVTVRVTLNANSHDPLAVGDAPLAVEKTVAVD